MIFVTFFLWVALMPAIYAFAPRLYAVWIVLIGGWLLLPPAIYAEAGEPSVFPFWIIGSGLPSDLLITKAWIAPGIATLGSLLFDRGRWVKFQWHWTDLALLGFCLWPLGQSFLLAQSDPHGSISSIYMAGAWGLPWLIGRLYLRDRRDAEAFTAVLAVATLAMLPVIIIETVSTFRIHTLFFGAHPFAFDGAPRYLGYRPQLLFENGNQHGLWCAGATIAAFWRIKEAPSSGRRLWIVLFVTLLAITTASQSVGAILLTLGGLAMLAIPKSFRLMRSLGVIVFAICLFLAALHASRIVPLRTIAENTAFGKAVVGGFRSTGRGSFVWRIGQDVKTLPLIAEKPVVGSGRWNWFMPVDSRSWGFPLLVVGQFGLIGFALLAAALLEALYRHASNAARGSATARMFTVMLLLFGLDALLNSFLFYPAILVAAALARPTIVGHVPETFSHE